MARIRASLSGSGGGGAVELVFDYKSLGASEALVVPTTKKARGIVVMFPYGSNRIIHYYVSADTPNDVYYGLQEADAIDAKYSTVFSDNSITFNLYFSSTSLTVYYVIIY